MSDCKHCGATEYACSCEEILALRARIAELERERDEEREAAASLRSALVLVRDAMTAADQSPDGDDDPRRPVASAVWRVLRETR